jgi:DNA invertase Pin-like site-specific DNA recombinase
MLHHCSPIGRGRENNVAEVGARRQVFSENDRKDKDELCPGVDAVMKVAVYLRVSTSEQSVEAQRLELVEYCRRRGWDDVREYRDQISGAKCSRIGLDLLMIDVRKRSVQAVVCTKLDRLGRSLSHLAQICDEMMSHRVALVCPSQGIDTTEDNPAGRLQMHVLMAVAEFERALISDRTKAGLTVARANGKTLGRRRFKLTPSAAGVIEAWRTSPKDERLTIAELATALGCSVGTAHKLAKA